MAGLPPDSGHTGSGVIALAVDSRDVGASIVFIGAGAGWTAAYAPPGACCTPRQRQSTGRCSQWDLPGGQRCTVINWTLN